MKSLAKRILTFKIFPDEIYIGEKRITNKQMNVAACSAGAALASVIAINIFFGEDMQLSMLEGNPDESCYSYNEDSRYKNEQAAQTAEDVLEMIEQFHLNGYEQAADMRGRGAGFCFGIPDESVRPTAIWPRLDWHFAEAEYPEELAALNFFNETRQNYWQEHIQDPNALNQYTFESALLFSRLTRAANIAGELADLIEVRQNRHNTIEDYVWARYIEENPELENTVRALLDNYNGEIFYNDAIKAAIDTYLQDAEALAIGDREFLNRYLYHVSIIEERNHTGIYNGPRYGNYAKVDADRDGERDDVIFMGHGYTQQQVWYDADFIRRLSRQQTSRQVSYECGTTDNPRTCYRTEWDDVSGTVTFNSIPAADTGTINIHPQTIVTIGQLMNMNLWNTDEAQAIIQNPLYSQPLSPDNASLFIRISEAANRNISGRNTGTQTPDFGINIPSYEE